MRTILFVIVLLLLAIAIYFFILGARSKSGEAPGLSAGELAQCGSKPNCVCSEHNDKNDFYIEPLAFKPEAEDPLAIMRAVIHEAGGVVVDETDGYLATTFTSGTFRFVDDVEIRLDEDNSVLHIRSASRVGHSDMGANRKRVEQLRSLFELKIRE